MNRSKKNSFHHLMPLLACRINAGIIACALLIFLAGCQQKALRMQVDNISRENLASYHVGTPDPRLIYPPLGQRMTLSWYVPKQEFEREDLSIKISIIYGNHTQDDIWYRPKQYCGMYVRALLNEEYFEKCGILTYKADMYACGRLIKCWRHHLWAELISFAEIEDAASDD